MTRVAGREEMADQFGHAAGFATAILAQVDDQRIGAREQRHRLRISLGDELGRAEEAQVEIADIAGQTLDTADPEAVHGHYLANHDGLLGGHRLAVRPRRGTQARRIDDAEMRILADAAQAIGQRRPEHLHAGGSLIAAMRQLRGERIGSFCRSSERHRRCVPAAQGQ